MTRKTVMGFKLERTEEALTAHGGLALMGEYNNKLGLRSFVDACLPTAGSNRGYAPSVFVESLVLMLQGGGRCLDDLRGLEKEEGLMALIGRETIPDASTVGDWLRRMGDVESGSEGLSGLAEVRDRLTERLLGLEALTEYTLDADATQIEGEKREAQWTYKGVQGYMPMLGFLFENGLCLLDEFREGATSPARNASPGGGQVAFYQECRKRMPAGKRIARYRADSASYQSDLINALEGDGVVWAITADQDCAVKAVVGAIPKEGWREPVCGCGYEVAETVHSMGKTDNSISNSIMI